ncbi:glycosyltransferase family 39 protein [bacterium]|nr:glycosyltransferase family 39 protein [bacterium]
MKLSNDTGTHPFFPLSSGAVLFIWGIVLLLPFLGLRHLWLPDEGRYAEVAREMVVSGDWLTPRLDFIPHFTKPPLTYWFIAAALKVLGTNEFAARLFNALALIGTVLVTASLTRELGNRTASFRAGFILLTSLFPFVAGNVLTTDIQLTFWQTTAVWLFWKGYNGWPEGKLSVFGAYAALGMAFMTKGPVGVLVPVMAFAGYCLYQRNTTFVKRVFSWTGILLFCCIAFPWYIVVALKNPGLMNYFLGNEIAGRVLTTVHHRNNTFLIYPLVLTAGMLPWTWYQMKALVHTFTFSKIRRKSLSPAEVFCASWIIIPLLFFSLVRSRLPFYVLNLFIPLSILTARYLDPETDTTKKNPVAVPSDRKFLTIALAMSVFLLLATGISPYIPTSQDLYPLASAITSYAGREDYSIYSTSSKLYSLNFYTGKTVHVVQDAAPFSDDTKPSFFLTKQELPATSGRDDIRCVARHFRYRLYFHK